MVQTSTYLTFRNRGGNYTIVEQGNPSSSLKPTWVLEAARSETEIDRTTVTESHTTTSVCLPSNALNAPQNTNIAGPSASATGNVTNQAGQVLQGPYSTTSYGSGVVCQGPTMSVSTFTTGNNNYNWDPETYLTGNRNLGITLGVSVPLDGESVELCKERYKNRNYKTTAKEAKTKADLTLSWYVS